MEQKYKENDVIRFMTNGPQSHLMEMFGYCEFSPEEIQREEYTGRIKTVIDNGTSYLMSTLSPLKGFFCIADASDIIRKVSLDELSSEELEEYQARAEWMEKPNVYINDASGIDCQNCDVAGACEQAAAKAMKALFPEQKVVDVKMEKDSWFTREWYLGNLDHFLRDEIKNKPEYEGLKKRRDFLAGKFSQARFKEYYSVTVAVERPANEEDRMMDRQIIAHLKKHFGKEFKDEVPFSKRDVVTVNWLVAVDKNFEEVSVMKDISDRSDFFRSLGPEFHDMSEAADDFRNRCLSILYPDK